MYFNVIFKNVLNYLINRICQFSNHTSFPKHVLGWGFLRITKKNNNTEGKKITFYTHTYL